MYKPNGEELMSPLEEMEAREKMSKKAKHVADASPTIDSLRSALYSALYGARSSGSREVLDPCDINFARNPR
jgi:hypothetical protein